MHTWRRSLFQSACILSGIVVAACGSGGTEEPNINVVVDNLEADIVIAAYEEGRLGSPDEVRADMAPFLEKLRVPDPIDASGRIAAYDDMPSRQKMAFDDWHRTSQKVANLVGPEKLRAKQDLLRQLEEKEKSK